MTIAQSMLPEFDQEMAGTRKVLERVPQDKLEWRIHPKSNTLGWLANHLAEIPSWTGITILQDTFDVAPPGGEKYESPKLTSVSEIVATFDKNVADARQVIAAATDATLLGTWTMYNQGQKIFSMPKVACLRTWLLNHTIHHRAIMTVYLRVNEVPVPALYGPSADEAGM